MESRKEPARKPTEKKSPGGMGNNVIWYLLALGIGTVFLVSLLATRPDVEIPITELVALINKGSDAKNAKENKPPASIDVRSGESDGKVRRFSHLRNLTIGVSEITGKVDMRRSTRRERPSARSNKSASRRRGSAWTRTY